ncbi:WD40 repeat domain-containing protein [Lignipirellula cremea]|uniref:WD domain, G-beta repeat n=1 Tax=Lignipirellula cremea TaxID=2528010 RepID=A0A518E1Q8_9BACT|nr:hypothetical protein [Lignipirellula cremea]QDU98002.1 WD domain, G-beta repeat [Lignipirellula cremea]
MASFNPKQAKLSHQLTFEGQWPSAVAFLDNERLAAANRDGQMYLWDLSQDAAEATEAEAKDKERTAPNVLPVRRLLGHTNGVTRLLTIDQGKTLISSSLDHSIRLWDTTAPATGKIDCVLDIAQRRRLIKRDKSNKEEVLSAPGVEIETQQSVHELQGHSDWVVTCDVSGDGSRLLSGDGQGVSILWDLKSRKETDRWSGHKMNGVVSVSLSPDGKKCFVSEHSEKWDDFDRPPAQAKIFALDPQEMLVDLIRVKFPEMKERSSSYGHSRIWIKWVGSGFVASDFSPDGKYLAVGQGGEIGDAVAYLIDAETGEEIREFAKHKYGICDLRFTADGKHLLTSGRDTLLKIFQVADGKEVASLGKSRGGQFQDWFHAIAVSPDENRIAVADIAGLVQVWTLG